MPLTPSGSSPRRRWTQEKGGIQGSKMSFSHAGGPTSVLLLFCVGASPWPPPTLLTSPHPRTPAPAPTPRTSPTAPPPLPSWAHGPSALGPCSILGGGRWTVWGAGSPTGLGPPSLGEPEAGSSWDTWPAGLAAAQAGAVSERPGGKPLTLLPSTPTPSHYAIPVQAPRPCPARRQSRWQPPGAQRGEVSVQPHVTHSFPTVSR